MWAGWGVSDKPDLILELLTDLQTGQRQFRKEMHDFRDEMHEFRDEMHAFRRETRERLDRIDGRLGALEALVHQLARRVDALTHDVVGLKREAASLRQALTEYHGSVLGHGVLISELDERLGRVERHLGLLPT